METSTAIIVPPTFREPRRVERVVTAFGTLEGAGFPVRRPFPTQRVLQMDPFLLLDHLGPVDWAPGQALGAPDHPHRGFETVTYVLAGKLKHRDSTGGGGLLDAGDVQWMTAGGGIVHSELPEEEYRKAGGVMHGFQVWVNLPAKDKWLRPKYQERNAREIPAAGSEDGKVIARVIAGEALGKSAAVATHTPIQYIHFSLRPGGSVDQPIPSHHEGMAYVFAGEARIGREGTVVREGQLAKLSEGDAVRLSIPPDAPGGAEILLLNGEPIGEPIARYGPFVMNTEQEIHQAMADYRSGKMGSIPPETA